MAYASDPVNGVTEIWVRAGTYYVDQSCANEAGTGDRTETFQLVKDVFLLGGFNGTETFAFERDSVVNITILRGAVAQGQALPGCAANGLSCFEEHNSPGCLYDIDPQCCVHVCEVEPLCCDDVWDGFCVQSALDNCGGSYHVVTAGSEIDDPVNTLIDGFTIRDGTANGTVDLDKQGGGMLIEGEPSVVRCTFTQNTASNRGGGMSIDGNAIQPDIINSVFHHNPGDQRLIPTNGGGLASFLADAIVTNGLFVGNLATFDGGGIFNSGGECSDPAPAGGACGRITLINCTIVSNTADANDSGSGLGGGIFSGAMANLETTSLIVWDNQDESTGGGDETSQIAAGLNTVTYSDVQGVPVWPGTGNINDIPLFVAAGAGDYRLTIDSLCIDAGNPEESIIPCDQFDLDTDGVTCDEMDPDFNEPTPDLDLHDRVLGIVDMGAYEFILCPCADICPWDLNGDCVVGAADLLILLVAWGPCGDCDDCPADFDGTCSVGASDLLALLFNWGRCPCSEGPPPPSIEDEMAAHCLSMADWDAFVDMMTDPNSSQEDKDNYLCWMTHYLEGCTRCICIGSGCPGPDPYNG